MIYMVEHTFGLPEMEDDWNSWYADNVDNLLTVPGFETAQRFKIEGSTPPRYMAMYNVATPEVFNLPEYKSVGGGGVASARFRPAYFQWRRSLFAAPAPAPNVEANQVLLAKDGTFRGEPPYLWLESQGKQKNWVSQDRLLPTPPFRGILSVAKIDLPRLWGDANGVDVYAAITTQQLPTTNYR